MSPAQLVKELIGRIGQDSSSDYEECWTVDKVEALLAKLAVSEYEFDYEPRVVVLDSLEDLYKMMDYAGKTELSDSCLMSMSKWKKKVCLHVGGWQFEAGDTRN